MVLTTRNRPRFLQVALACYQHQTYPLRELIVVDDGDQLPADESSVEAVGGTMLLVRADLHRDGLIFPAFPYGQENARRRPERGELETEGLGLMAQDMGHECWGTPHLEIRHARW